MHYEPYTSDFAKYVGESLDVSPRKVDHLINGYLGFLGKFAFSTVGTSSASFSLDNLPMVRRFTFDPYAKIL